jgi:hypothetical protein
MENNCYFVSSRGLLKSCSFHSNNPKSGCNTDNQYLLDMISSSNMFDGMTIYVCSELLNYFILFILPDIRHKFILVSGDSDLISPCESIEEESLFLSLINNNNLIKWFSQNITINSLFNNNNNLIKWFSQDITINSLFNNKIIQLPIGLDYHTFMRDPFTSWNHTKGVKYLPIQQENMIHDCKINSNPFSKRQIKIYANFNFYNDRFKDRINIQTSIPKNLLHLINKPIPRIEYFKDIIQFAFVISPYGNGLDCHRTWETLCLGSIPIVRATVFSKMFENLPVLIVNEWTDINKELLENTITEFTSKVFDYNKLRLKFWTDQFCISEQP